MKSRISMKAYRNEGKKVEIEWKIERERLRKDLRENYVWTP